MPCRINIIYFLTKSLSSGLVAQAGQSGWLLTSRSWVQIPPSPPMFLRQRAPGPFPSMCASGTAKETRVRGAFPGRSQARKEAMGTRVRGWISRASFNLPRKSARPLPSISWSRSPPYSRRRATRASSSRESRSTAR